MAPVLMMLTLLVLLASVSSAFGAPYATKRFTGRTAPVAHAASHHGRQLAVFKLHVASHRIRRAVLRDAAGRHHISLHRIRVAAKRGLIRLHVVTQTKSKTGLRKHKPTLVVTVTPTPTPTTTTPPASTGSTTSTIPTTTTPSPTPVSTDPSVPDLGAVASGATLNQGCLPAYGTFSLTVRPPGCWRPYGANSPFNRQIAANAPTAGNSAAVVSRVLGFGPLQHMQAGQAGTTKDWGHPVYWSSPTDPVFTIHCTEQWGTCAIEGMQVRIPDGAKPAGGDDAHLTVIDQLTGVEVDLWHVQSKPAGGGLLTAGWGGKTNINGDGLGSGAVAANYGTAAGLIRAEELEAGHINHALFMTVNCDSGQAVYPANKSGASCASAGLSSTDAPAMGTRFQLTMSSADIDALAVPAWKKTILHAMADYGMIVGDTGGTWGLKAESGIQYTSLGQPDKWVALAKQWNLPYSSTDNVWIFNIRDGVDWAKYLRVVPPCVSSGTC